MAEAEKSYYKEQFLCSVCLDVRKEPVTIPCGHNYCMSCINDVWSGLDPNSSYGCPQCRESFSPRPAVKKNTLVAEVMEKMKSALDLACASHRDATACARSECDFCIGARNKADKFCLQCLASYCEHHLQPHYKSPVFMKHKLVPASSQVQENVCSHHGKLLDIYCCDDQQCICYMCMVESHKGHISSSVEAERMKSQDALEKSMIACHQMIAEREEGLMKLTNAVTSIKRFAQAVEEDGEKMFTELIDSMKARCAEVKTLIRRQEKAELGHAEDLRLRFESELTLLRARIAEIQPLLSTDSHIDFIQKHASIPAIVMSKDLPLITCVTSGNISRSDFKKHIEDVCQEEIAKIVNAVLNIHIVEPAEPESREDFLKYFFDLHVDPNTINNSLSLSEGDKKVTQCPPAYPYPDHPERFKGFANALCKEALCGQCYWEADCSGNDWSVAVAYRSMMRKGEGDECRLGFNPKSWRLSRSNHMYYFRHHQTVITLHQYHLTTIGVYLNHSAGTLSFYGVSDRMVLLHKVQTIFTEPLYAAFGVGGGSSVRIRPKCERSIFLFN